MCVWEGGRWGLRLHEARVACVYVTQIYQFTYWLTDEHVPAVQFLKISLPHLHPINVFIMFFSCFLLI